MVANQIPTSPKHDIQLVISLPLQLIEKVEGLVEQGYARNRDVLLAAAIESFIVRLEERNAVDAELLAMANDPEFQSLNLQVAEEFSGSDYQALKEDEHEAR